MVRLEEMESQQDDTGVSPPDEEDTVRTTKWGPNMTVTGPGLPPKVFTTERPKLWKLVTDTDDVIVTLTVELLGE